MKVISVVENVSHRDDLFSQYGLSLFVKTAGGNILVDCGQDETSLANFEAMKLNAEDIDAIFISHNHEDHIGGMQAFIDATSEGRVPVYVSERARRKLYAKRLFHRRVLVSRNELIEANAERVVRVNDCVEILPGAYACEIRGADPKFVCRDRKLRMLDGGALVRDSFEHEIYLAVIEDGEVKIVSPCSHSGIVNIIRDAEERFNLPVTSFVGGLHLRGSSSRSLCCKKSHVYRIADELGATALKKLYTCHCTGYKAVDILRERLNSIEIKHFHTGAILNV